MAIDVNAANVQAYRLTEYANRLQDAKSRLANYKNTLTSEWEGPEVRYILQGVDKAISEINSIIRELNCISTDVRNVANTIRREEEAAARARAEKEQRIRVAQENYNKAARVVDDLARQREELKLLLSRTTSARKKKELEEQLAKLQKQINKEVTKRDACYQNLLSARR